MFCKNCGASISDGEMFCPNCGTKQDSAPVSAPTFPAASASVPVSGAPVEKAAQAEKKPKKPALSKKMIGIICFLCIIAVGAVFGVKIVKSLVPSQPEFILYANNKGMYSKFKGEESVEKHASFDDIDAFNGGYAYDEKSNRLFYGDRTTNGTFSLYYTDMSAKPEKRVAEKLDANVRSYSVPEGGEAVYYLNDNGILYKHDLTEKVKVASDVIDYLTTEDAKKIFIRRESAEKDPDYTTYDYSIIDENGKETSVVKSGRLGCGINGGGICIWDSKSIYVFDLTDGFKKIGDIDASAESILVMYADKNCAYYIVREKDEPLANYVTDKAAESDKTLTEPDKRDRKYWKEWEQGFFDDYATEYTDEYYAELKAYQEKLMRDRCREWLSDATLSNAGIYTWNLFYCTNGKSTRIAERCLSDSRTENIGKSGAAVFSSYIFSEEKTELLDLVGELSKDNSLSRSNIMDSIEEKIVKGLSDCVAIDGTVSELNRRYAVNEDGSKNTRFENDNIRALYNEKDSSLYFIIELDENTECGTLYKSKINSNKAGAKETVYEDVYAFRFDSSGHLLNARNAVAYDNDNVSADLFSDDKKIDTDVFLIEASFDKNMTTSVRESADGTLTYGTSYSEDEYTRTLRQYDGKDAFTVASDVVHWLANGKNNCAYITIADGDDFEDDGGTLSLYKDGEKTVIANGVYYILYSSMK